ncbi:MAG: Rieske (2Fe-2S) protein, partial [Pseudomonadales bacterium]|nr:Rieske (2Fe-2S) protein [Pseudomonadales bacterium]
MSAQSKLIDVSHIEMPKDNPVKRQGNPMPKEGDDGLFSQSWFPVCLSSEVDKGQIRGENFLDGRIIVCRGEDGVVR